MTLARPLAPPRPLPPARDRRRSKEMEHGRNMAIASSIPFPWLGFTRDEEEYIAEMASLAAMETAYRIAERMMK